jgi:hypothetical protein
MQASFDWRTIRHIRRLAQAFDPVTLESWVYSPERQDELQQAASLQNRSGAAVTPSAREDRGTKFGEAPPDYEERQRATDGHQFCSTGARSCHICS